MKRPMMAAIAAATALGCGLSAMPASAQYNPYRDYRYGRSYDRDYQYRNWRYRHRSAYRSDRYRWHYYGSSYGYSGYRGPWRTGYRFPYWRDSDYLITDYDAYDLPPPRRGYRYYRDDNGDIVMAAIGSGIIGLILGSALASD